MSDNKVSVEEALVKLYDLSWMIGSMSMEYLTDKDGEKIRDYLVVIDDRINDLVLCQDLVQIKMRSSAC